MWKHFLFLIIASLAVILLLPFLNIVPHYLLYLHKLVIQLLNQVFAGGRIALIVKGLLGLFIIPVAVCGVLGGIYWIFKRSTMPYLIHLMWITWLILAVAMICR